MSTVQSEILRILEKNGPLSAKDIGSRLSNPLTGLTVSRKMRAMSTYKTKTGTHNKKIIYSIEPLSDEIPEIYFKKDILTYCRAYLRRFGQSSVHQMFDYGIINNLFQGRVGVDSKIIQNRLRFKEDIGVIRRPGKVNQYYLKNEPTGD